MTVLERTVGTGGPTHPPIVKLASDRVQADRYNTALQPSSVQRAATNQTGRVWLPTEDGHIANYFAGLLVFHSGEAFTGDVLVRPAQVEAARTVNAAYREFVTKLVKASASGAAQTIYANLAQRY